MVTEGNRSIAGRGPRATLARGTPRGVTRLLACAGVAVGALGGCTLITDSFLTNDFSGDPFPVNIDTTSGAIMVGMRHPGLGDRPAVLDLLSPFTVIDQDPALDPTVSYVDLTLLGARNPSGPLDLSTVVPRAVFPEAQLVALHPCNDECDAGDLGCDPAQCNVGVAAARQPFQGIIGADVLAGDAVRLRLGDNQLFVLPDIGGSDRGRTLDCDAVFDSPYRGGGTLVISGTELPFGNRRITLQACLGEDPDPGPTPAVAALNQNGTDALLVVSTSIGTSILDEAAYQRYLLAHPAAPALANLPMDSVYLPSGLVSGHRTTIDRLALVAISTSNALSPCRQLYAHRLLTTYALPPDLCQVNSNGVSLFDCPCKDGSPLCPVPAIVELTPPAGIDVLVVSDDDPTLQALRAELRPDQPEVDGLLGTNALRTAEIDVDYPHDRLLARCPGGNCSARPQLAQASDICQINRCITGRVTAPNCPGGTSLCDPVAGACPPVPPATPPD